MTEQLIKMDLRGKLDKAGIGPTEFARCLGVSKSTIFRWLNGETVMSKSHEIAVDAVLTKILRERDS